MADGAQPPAVRTAVRADVPDVASCLASAFHDDPLWGRWTFPDEQSRAERLVPFMRFWARCSVRHGWLWATGDCEAVALWTPPGVVYVAKDDEPELDGLLHGLVGSRVADVYALFDQFDEHLPAGDYYHLEWWATHPEHTGRGLGTALLRENLARIDALGMPAYLESTNPVNLPRYEALGFLARNELSVPGGPVITTMWREPR
jgi:GNAT superfamily N-acetyltransferase